MGDFTLDQIADLPLDLLIGGRAVAASDGGRFDVVDPATGEVITTVADGTVVPTLVLRPLAHPRQSCFQTDDARVCRFLQCHGLLSILACHRSVWR